MRGPVNRWDVRGRSARDKGAASILVLAVGLVLVAAGLAGAAVGAARVARHQARVAADLGALAGAARTLADPAGACTAATEIVQANGGEVVACAVLGLDLELTVRVHVSPLPGLARAAEATALAGPVRG
ncbi:pilus assembly protein TadG-related protein [Solwaraspora sp. WMMD1047]|uniref:Rv3654c family TadE-like protein n=1 Tax=Solwaraspora sp. WMMD1047 TaxID=3016102 RepID=UPI002417C872|nr:Rv3654c family TadE-like protein [Solwaraspora sp. WMMD1047]MDG4833859.1 pilus assembly protein TadG-related protein [Solwaraspora sp. WMMD1047]